MRFGIQSKRKGSEKMSKKTEVKVQPLSENTKKAIIITAICVVAAVILAIALALILKPTPIIVDNGETETTKTPSTDSATIKNGSFDYVSKESYNDEEAVVKEAQNWWKNTYALSEGEEPEYKFENVDGKSSNVEMGIVDTNDESWSKVVAYLTEKLGSGFADLQNPSVHNNSELTSEDARNVYMIALGNGTGVTNAGICLATNSSSTLAPASYSGINTFELWGVI